MKKLLLALCLLSLVNAEDNRKSSGVMPTKDTTYIKECGSCHFAFQAGLLPKRSWWKLMNNLENHFESDATLEKQDYQHILNYLTSNAADNAMEYKRSKKINNSIAKDESPIHITKTPYFIKKHKTIPTKLITQKEIGLISNCAACHITASQGIYSERAIKIPNYGRWDD